MEGLDGEDGQWIILMGLIISVSIFILAIIVNQSILVGQTTSESVLDFPKSEIQDIRSEVIRYRNTMVDPYPIQTDIEQLTLFRKTALVNISNTSDRLTIHYNNGVTYYHEIIQI
ncbi:MAG: hypothetical protein A4E36_00188 [Methanoregulaceae archaeon PtaB.Bin009]|jgi:hypothetical protein|nr:MAG: hypothetical protein A4E36_00188 [Methanoregulaceae archaeon PtaB.Bin009]